MGRDTDRGEWRLAWDLWRAEREGPSGLARRRDRRLTRLLAHAHRSSPYYRRLYGTRSPHRADLPNLPTVAKPELMAAFDEWVTDRQVTRAGVDLLLSDPGALARLHLGRYFVCTTSGTTGHPGVFLYDRASITLFRAMMLARADLHWVPVRRYPALIAHRFRWAAVIGTGGRFAGAGWIELERSRSTWRAKSYRTISALNPLDRVVAELNRWDPAILTGYPSAIELLTEEQRAGRLHIHPVFVETSGETADASLRADAAAAFGCPVHDAYACTEFFFVALGCSEGWLHVNSDWVILEPVEADGSPTPPGRPSHTVLLTNLVNHVQPIIRYDLGDSILAKPGPCACGLLTPAIQVMGRRDDVLHLAASRGGTVAILPLAIGSVAEEVSAVSRCQLTQTGPAAISVRFDTASAEPDRVWRDLQRALLVYLEEQGVAGATVARDPEPPRTSGTSGKFRQVIARPSSSGTTGQ